MNSGVLTGLLMNAGGKNGTGIRMSLALRVVVGGDSELLGELVEYMMLYPEEWPTEFRKELLSYYRGKDPWTLQMEEEERSYLKKLATIKLLELKREEMEYYDQLDRQLHPELHHHEDQGLGLELA